MHYINEKQQKLSNQLYKVQIMPLNIYDLGGGHTGTPVSTRKVTIKILAM